MKNVTWIVITLMLVASPAPAHKQCDKAACAAVKAKIKDIESRMRSGYTRNQGERYEARLRELKARRYKLCR